MLSWKTHFSNTSHTPNTLVVQGLEHTRRRTSALDLGSGNFRDSRFLREQGFVHVFAVDGSLDTPPVPHGVHFKRERLETYEPGMHVHDFVCCMYSLFFLKKVEVYRLFERVQMSLVPGGVFVFNVLGEHDEWAGFREDVSFFGRDEANVLKQNWGNTLFEETRPEKRLTSGKMKRWHLYNVIYTKP